MSLVFSCPVTTAKENSRSSKKGRSEGTHILEEWKFGFYTSKKDFWLADVLTEVMWRVWLVAQWQRICLPMQETRVWSLVREDLSCNGATKPVCRNYWTCALESGNYNYWACMPQILKPSCPRVCALQQQKPLKWAAQEPQLGISPCLPQEKAHAAIKTWHSQK